MLYYALLIITLHFYSVLPIIFGSLTLIFCVLKNLSYIVSFLLDHHPYLLVIKKKIQDYISISLNNRFRKLIRCVYGNLGINQKNGFFNQILLIIDGDSKDCLLTPA